MPLPYSPAPRTPPPAVAAQVRVTAASEQDLVIACAALEAALGSRIVLLRQARAGRRGDWLAYGTLRVETTPGDAHAR